MHAYIFYIASFMSLISYSKDDMVCVKSVSSVFSSTASLFTLTRRVRTMSSCTFVSSSNDAFFRISCSIILFHGNVISLCLTTS